MMNDTSNLILNCVFHRPPKMSGIITAFFKGLKNWPFPQETFGNVPLRNR